MRRTAFQRLSIVFLALVSGAIVFIRVPAHATRSGSCRVEDVTRGTAPGADLQRAIDAADPGDTITIKHECVGTFRVEKDLSLVGKTTVGAPGPVLRSAGMRVLRVSASVTVTNLKITGGYAGREGYGGGIFNTGSLTLRDTVVCRNTAEIGGGVFTAKRATLTLSGSSSVRRNNAFWGGGIFDNRRSSVTLDDTSSVRGNDAGSGQGGIYNVGTLVMNDTSSVRGNSAVESAGGIGNSGSVTLNDDASVRRNTAKYAAGIDNVGILTLNDKSSVRGNSAQQGVGGIFTTGTVTLNGRSSVRDNEARHRAGGVEVPRHGIVVLAGSSSVTGNAAGSGGGIHVRGGTVILRSSSIVTENTASNVGGGVYIHGTTSVVSACDASGVDEWTGTVEPNDPNDFKDGEVTKVTCS
jgi:hypothetical protein